MESERGRRKRIVNKVLAVSAWHPNWAFPAEGRNSYFS